MDQKYNENHCIDGGGILYGSVLTTFWLDILDSLTSPYETSTVSPSVCQSVSHIVGVEDDEAVRLLWALRYCTPSTEG